MVKLMKKIIFSIILTLTLTACGQDKDADGVPKIINLDAITVNDQPMTATAFYNEFCRLKPNNETCMAVAHQSLVESNLKATQSTSNHKW